MNKIACKLVTFEYDSTMKSEEKKQKLWSRAIFTVATLFFFLFFISFFQVQRKQIVFNFIHQ